MAGVSLTVDYWQRLSSVKTYPRLLLMQNLRLHLIYFRMPQNQNPNRLPAWVTWINQ